MSVLSILPILISFVAIVISTVSVIVVISNNRKVHRQQEALFHIERNMTFEGRLADWPDAFRFYGVDVEKAKTDGISPEQITYLVLSINSLSSIAQFSGISMKEEIEGNAYRERMFKNEVTRMTWKYARYFFSDDTVEAVDEYLKEHFTDDKAN